MFIDIILRRADLDGLVADKVDQSIALCYKVIAARGYGAGDISKVVLIATNLGIDPRAAVVRGAAIYGESHNSVSGETEAKPARVAQAAGGYVFYDHEAHTACRRRAMMGATMVNGR